MYEATRVERRNGERGWIKIGLFDESCVACTPLYAVRRITEHDRKRMTERWKPKRWVVVLVVHCFHHQQASTSPNVI